MKTNEKKNTSAKKKLIPAVAMLTTSAVMLSTATYAWFTMSREVEVTGIKLTATTPQTIEISLGQATETAHLLQVKRLQNQEQTQLCGHIQLPQVLYTKSLESSFLPQQLTDMICSTQKRL